MAEKTIDEILGEILSEMDDREFAEKWGEVKGKSGNGITVEEYFSGLDGREEPGQVPPP